MIIVTWNENRVSSVVIYFCATAATNTKMENMHP